MTNKTPANDAGRGLVMPEIPSSEATRLGLPPESTRAALQTDVFKELTNKLAWALGTTYRVPYSNGKDVARAYALRIATRCLKDHGYPGAIALEWPERPG